MTEVKSCPFCGFPAMRHFNGGSDFNAYAHTVTYACVECGASQKAVGDTSKGGYADNSKVEATALARWNRRV